MDRVLEWRRLRDDNRRCHWSVGYTTERVLEWWKLRDNGRKSHHWNDAWPPVPPYYNIIMTCSLVHTISLPSMLPPKLLDDSFVTSAQDQIANFCWLPIVPTTIEYLTRQLLQITTLCKLVFALSLIALTCHFVYLVYNFLVRVFKVKLVDHLPPVVKSNNRKVGQHKLVPAKQTKH